MPQYQLEIEIDSDGLKTLHAAGQRVCLVKSTTPSTLPVIWVAIDPEQNNTVKWTESYSVYGSETKIQNGATIHTSSTLQGTGGFTYPFAGGQFQPGTSNLPLNEYGIKNLDDDPEFKLLTAGLAQVASGTGSSQLTPLNATVVPYNETGIYTPIEKVSVFAEAQANNGLIISTVASSALLVDLTEKPTKTIHYDDASNTFQPGSLPK